MRSLCQCNVSKVVAEGFIVPQGGESVSNPDLFDSCVARLFLFLSAWVFCVITPRVAHEYKIVAQRAIACAFTDNDASLILGRPHRL